MHKDAKFIRYMGYGAFMTLGTCVGLFLHFLSVGQVIHLVPSFYGAFVSLCIFSLSRLMLARMKQIEEEKDNE